MGDTRHCRRWGQSVEQEQTTWNRLLGGSLCLIMVFAQVGCRSVYRFHCTSRPFPAGVVVGQQMLGETPCTVKIPKDSELIRDDKIEFTFCLPDGPERTHTVDLHGLKPSNPFAEIVATPLVFTGLGLIFLSGGDDDDEDEDAPLLMKHHRKKKHKDDLGVGLFGFGVAATGSGVFHLLGGDDDSLSGYKIYVDFNEPAQIADP